ncbi:MAG: methionyl-tRNA formyltransferase [Cyanothece sp. SIO1E1]|nr:methionyl-tRNA formyltransferase [Cyanothece sp. SIO1E1]
MRVIFFGTPQFAVPSLERLLGESAFEILAVVTQPDKRRGRGKQLTPSPIKALAIKHNRPVWQPRRIKQDAETLDQLRSADADAFVVVAYGQILSQEILDMPRWGCINAHGSILPKYRGAAPIQWSLYHGESETGITTMLMDAGMDTGPMLVKTYTPIDLLDNSLDVAKTLATQSAALLVKTLLQLERQEIQAVPQDEAAATYAPLIQKTNYQLDWSRSAIALHNQIRGFFPNCFTGFRDSTLKVSATVPLGADYWPLLSPTFQALEQEWSKLTAQVDDSPSQPGEIVEIIKGYGPVVQTGTGQLLLWQVQLAGKRSQSGWDFANGTRLEIGEQLQIPPPI